jgi:hypothetical protein
MPASGHPAIDIDLMPGTLLAVGPNMTRDGRVSIPWCLVRQNMDIMPTRRTNFQLHRYVPESAPTVNSRIDLPAGSFPNS